MTASYDLVIIGGGIHGVGIAQAAAARGWSVLVLEQTDIASGTSSRSSKLIHGGLRYLENGQFSLVRECLNERALLLKLAPQLVQLKPFHIPVYRYTKRRPWQLQAGLSLYALLGGLLPLPRPLSAKLRGEPIALSPASGREMERGLATRFRRVPQSQWSNLDGLETTGLQTVFQYYDAQTDDAALTRAVMRSAQELGAQLIMPATFIAAQSHEQGSIVEYRYNGKTETCNASVLVNAAGPWVQQVLSRITPAPTQRNIDLVQGTHIVVPGKLTQGIYYVEAPTDGRAVFVMPWKDNTLVGTTESVYHGDPGEVKPLPQEQAYLLQTLAHYFPQHREQQNILATMAGLRVLPADEGAAFSRSRETILHPDRSDHPGSARLLTVYGGKLTTYRLTAERVVARLAEVLPRRKAIADTRQLRLS